MICVDMEGMQSSSEIHQLTKLLAVERMLKEQVRRLIVGSKLYCIVLYSSIYVATLNSRGQTEALLVQLVRIKETSFK